MRQANCDTGQFDLSVFVLAPSPSLSGTPKGGPECLMSLSCLESQGCQLIPLSYILSYFFSLILLLFLSCRFSANGPFTSLSNNLFFVKGQAFLYCSC